MEMTEAGMILLRAIIRGVKRGCQVERRDAGASEHMKQTGHKLPRALLFDMDGTLTEPLLDFPAIRADIGVPAGHGLLEWMATLPDAERAAAQEKLHAHEDRAATASTLNSGCDELLAWVRERRLPTALITRNSRKSA